MRYMIVQAVIVRWTPRRSEKAPAKEAGVPAESFVVHFVMETNGAVDVHEQQKQAILAFANQKDASGRDRKPDEILSGWVSGTYTVHVVTSTRPFEASMLPTIAVR